MESGEMNVQVGWRAFALAGSRAGGRERARVCSCVPEIRRGG